MSIVQPSQCSVFVQVWVDVRQFSQDGLTGIFLIDSNLSHGSSGQASTALNTNVQRGTNICWSLLSLTAGSDTILEFQDFGEANVFGSQGTPQPINMKTWTGTVWNAGYDQYRIDILARYPDQRTITTTITPSITSA